MTDIAARLRAFAKDCVSHGDMTPMAARMLNKIADEIAAAEADRTCPECAHWKALWRQDIANAADAIRERDEALARLADMRWADQIHDACGLDEVAPDTTKEVDQCVSCGQVFPNENGD